MPFDNNVTVLQCLHNSTCSLQQINPVTLEKYSFRMLPFISDQERDNEWWSFQQSYTFCRWQILALGNCN